MKYEDDDWQESATPRQESATADQPSPDARALWYVTYLYDPNGHGQRLQGDSRR